MTIYLMDLGLKGLTEPVGTLPHTCEHRAAGRGSPPWLCCWTGLICCSGPSPSVGSGTGSSFCYKNSRFA